METDAMAKRMIAIAREEGVPVMQKCHWRVRFMPTATLTNTSQAN